MRHHTAGKLFGFLGMAGRAIDRGSQPYERRTRCVQTYPDAYRNSWCDIRSTPRRNPTAVQGFFHWKLSFPTLIASVLLPGWFQHGGFSPSRLLSLGKWKYGSQCTRRSQGSLLQRTHQHPRQRLEKPSQSVNQSVSLSFPLRSAPRPNGRPHGSAGGLPDNTGPMSSRSNARAMAAIQNCTWLLESGARSCS